ncbi:phosphohistidine phosphatase [Flavobacterium sp. 316]|uniref:Histidine phosphatase family protein n=1 Tax=Flavobacterium sediminilitoris TaxID=2024526 RepID=A0ABY4HJZ8_9FLAO|nr:MULTISPECIES: histidine phosphatase family protein [Flavobacterium]KIX22914.1 phosphohistidine phosphatase [Flavobacterium sp. 316]UOX33163.1 histidine phosphatase family protein [Flavobacterium sediminilitoris]
MKNLILIRHSKSSWETPLKDIDRPLSKRGVNDAHLISSQINAILPKSFIVWCSIARRAKESAIIYSENLNFPFDNIMIKEELYTFDEYRLEEIIKKCENRYDSLILFGHNEAITNFVNKFGNLLIDNVPTSGVVSLQFNIDEWKSLEKGQTIKTLFPSHYKNEQHITNKIH